MSLVLREKPFAEAWSSNCLQSSMRQALPTNISAGTNHDLRYYVSLLAYLATGPTVLSLYLFAVWCLTADLGLTSSFPWPAGPFSNWLIWLVLAVASNLAVSNLNRTSRLTSAENGGLNQGITLVTGSKQARLDFALWPKVSDGLSKRLQNFAHSPSNLPHSASSFIRDSTSVNALLYEKGLPDTLGS